MKLQQCCRSITSLLTLVAALSMTAAIAQEEESERRVGLDLEEIVVTGTSRETSQFDAPYAVTTISPDELVRLSPTNVVDLMNYIPGVYGESTGGEVQNVWRIRGVPNEGSFTQMQVDGAPVVGTEAGLFFVKADGFLRTDIMTESFEAVRGGPAAIYASNAVAIFNNVTRRGTDDKEAAIRATVGDIGLYRMDGYWSGPVGDDTYLAVGGFYRVSDGYRDTGFTVDEGGQFTANLTRKIVDGEFNVHLRLLDDVNTFFLPVPLADPRDPSNRLDDLLNPFTGTLTTPSLTRAQVLRPDGNGGTEVDIRDVTDGRAVKANTIGLDFTKDINETWTFSGNVRHSDISYKFDALYSGGPPDGADVFAANSFDAAVAAFGAGVSTIDFAIAGTGGADIFDPASTDGLLVTGLYYVSESEANSINGNLRLSGELDVGFGQHNLTVGMYHGRVTEDVDWFRQRHLLEIRSQPRPIDMIARDATGTILGYVTDDGVLNYGTTAWDISSDVREQTFFLENVWQVNGRLTIDAGVRQQNFEYRGGNRLSVREDLGDPTTLADDSVLGLSNTFVPISPQKVDRTSWTVGANYNISEMIGVYGRYAQSHLIRPAWAIVRGGDVEAVSDVDQIEVGLKLDFEKLQVFATVFDTEFNPFNRSFDGIDPVTGAVETQTFRGSVTGEGVEVAAYFQPTDVFSISGAYTYNTSELSDLTNDFGEPPISANGNRTTRQPEYYGYIEPAIGFDIDAARMDAFLRYRIVGDAFVDFNNSTALPDYNTVDAGVTINFDTWSFNIVGRNLSEEFGLTEGNPRADVVSGQGSPEAIYGRPLYGRTFEISAQFSF